MDDLRSLEMWSLAISTGFVASLAVASKDIAFDSSIEGNIQKAVISVQCIALQCSAVQCSHMCWLTTCGLPPTRSSFALHSVLVHVLHTQCTVQCSVEYSSIQYNTPAPPGAETQQTKPRRPQHRTGTPGGDHCTTALNCTELNGAALRCTALHYTALHNTSHDYTLMAFVTMHCTALNYTSLH